MKKNKFFKKNKIKHKKIKEEPFAKITFEYNKNEKSKKEIFTVPTSWVQDIQTICFLGMLAYLRDLFEEIKKII